VTVKATFGTISVTFNLTNQVVVASLTLLSGGSLTAFINTPFAQPVVFVIRDINSVPISGLTVNLNVVSGFATITPASATTDSQGQVSANVAAGSTAGNITVGAFYSTLSATAALTSRAPGPVLTSASFFNAASFAPGLAPCGLGTTIGLGLAPNIQGTVSGISPFGPLPYVLNGLSMTVNGIPVPIQSVTNANGQQQATFQTPCEVLPGSATVVVLVGASSTTVIGVPVLAAQPGIFTYQGPNNKVYGAVIRASDGSYVTPTSPLRRDETYYLVVTGLAQVSPATATNAAGVPNQNVVLPVLVGVNNFGVTVGKVTYLVGSIGVYLVEFQVPLSAATGVDQPLAVAVLVNGQLVFGNSVFLPGVI
jgi:uncharacterized protein (TIGR03437 family)